MISTYKFYDEKGRRLAAFCRFIDHEKAEIFILTCSLYDQFRKQFARSEYLKHILEQPLGSNPTIFTIDIKPEERELQTLIRHCTANYYIPITVEVSYEDEYLFAAKDYYTY